MVGVIVGLTLAATGAVYEGVQRGKAVKEARETEEDLEKRKEIGLTKSQEKDLKALLGAGYAGQQKHVLDAIQDARAGAGQIGTGEALVQQEIAQESAAEGTEMVGRAVQQADEAEKARLEAKYQEAKMLRMAAEEAMTSFTSDTLRDAGVMSATAGVGAKGADASDWETAMATSLQKQAGVYTPPSPYGNQYGYGAYGSMMQQPTANPSQGYATEATGFGLTDDQAATYIGYRMQGYGAEEARNKVDPIDTPGG